MKNIVLLFLFLVLSRSVTLAQEYKLENNIEHFNGSYTTDYLGNIFRFESGDVIRYNSEGKQTGLYSSREFGDIHTVDASNPMKILVVFAKFSTTVILDNSMSANTTIRMSLPGIPFFSLIATSRDGGYWIFDPQTRQLKKINDQLNIIAEGTNFSQITDIDVVPYKILDSGNWVVVATKNNGYMVFDRYGTYYKSIKEHTGPDFQVINDNVMFKDGNKMVNLDIKKGGRQTFLLPQNEEEDHCRVESKRIYIQHQNSLNIYSY